MDQKGLQVALVPAGSLLDPVDEVAVRLLQRDRFEHLDLERSRNIRMPRSQSSVTLYGSHPPRSECDAAEVVRGPAQRDGAPSDESPGRKKENHIAYSMVNHR